MDDKENGIEISTLGPSTVCLRTPLLKSGKDHDFIIGDLLFGRVNQLKA